MNHKVHLAHLGCAKNMVDSEIFLAHFDRLGFSQTENPNDADLVLVNTCGFITAAKEQSIDTIFEHVEAKNRRVVVAGCLYQRYANLPEQMPEVDGWLRTNNYKDVRTLIQKLGFNTDGFTSTANQYERVLLEKNSHAYLRISEGCNKNCSFCSIPGFKGRMVSRTIESLVEEAQTLIDNGIKELNIVSQDTCNYGVDIYGAGKGGKHFRTLLEKLTELDIERVRLLYLYPLWLDHNFYEFMAENPKICNYIDMPLQHASQKVLKSMKRPGNGDRYLEEISKIRTIMPDVSMRTTLIVGFPGETEADFQELNDFVREANFEWLGAFPYYREENTTAFNLNEQVHHKTKYRRQRQILNTYHQMRQNLPSRIGQTHRVILEEKIDNIWLARTYFQAPEVDGVVYVKNHDGYTGELLDVTITNELDFDLEADPKV
ncbi:MAG: 30S ribosomal protein S12 methylthiotransferase RimO [bacterium]|nr:30S ribosomal protein S12 methylthiotransferase RimO [bacterium]